MALSKVPGSATDTCCSGGMGSGVRIGAENSGGSAISMSAERHTGANSGAGADTGANSGAGADSEARMRAASSLFLLILLCQLGVNKTAGGLDIAAAGGLDWGTADGLEDRLVLDRGWTPSRPRRIPSLQLSSVMSGRFMRRW